MEDPLKQSLQTPFAVEQNHSDHKSPDILFRESTTTNRTMHFIYTNWKCTSVRVVDNDNTTTLYDVDWKFRKPLHLTVSSPNSNAPLGDIKFHTFKNRIDMLIHDHSVSMTARNALSKDFTYTSPAFSGATLTWRYHGGSRIFTVTCLNDASLPLARVSVDQWSMKKFASIEFCDEKASSGVAVDEMLVSGLAVAGYWLVLTTMTWGAFAAF